MRGCDRKKFNAGSSKERHKKHSYPRESQQNLAYLKRKIRREVFKHYLSVCDTEKLRYFFKFQMDSSFKN